MKNNLSIETICAVFCKANSTNLLDLYTRSRERRIVETRRMIWGYLRENTPMTLNELAELFNRDHCSVIHSVSKHRVAISLSTKGAPYDLDYSKKYMDAISEIRILTDEMLGKLIYRDYLLRYHCPTTLEFTFPVVHATSLREAIEQYELYNPITDEELIAAEAL